MPHRLLSQERDDEPLARSAGALGDRQSAPTILQAGPIYPGMESQKV